MTDRPDDASPADGRHRRDDLAAGQGIDPSPDAIPAEDLAQLAGIRDPVDQSAVASSDEIDRLGEITDTAIYQGDLEARAIGDDQPDEPDEENLELLLEDELRDGETDDADEAAEEGLTWVPPVDPPVTVTADGQIDVAAGFGTTADDEPFDADHHGSLELADDERTERVREALRAHAQTSALVDGLRIDTDGSVAIVRGRVPDLVDEEAVLAVVSEVEGITDVDNRIQVDAVG